jgi:hypothetical protein
MGNSMSDEIKWCCSAFKNSYDLAGDRSISVLVDRYSDGQPDFILQSRAFAMGEEPSGLRTSVPLSLVTESPIKFCPWCGKQLAKWYDRSIDAMIRPGLKIDKGF